MRKRTKTVLKVLAKILALPALIALFLGAAVLINYIQDRPVKKAPVVQKSPAAQSMSLAYQLATIDKGYVTRDDVAVTRFRTLLDQLSSKFNGTRQQISDVTVKGQSLLRDKYGIEESLLNIMEDMNQVLITKVNPSYPLYATAYVHLRKTGISRQQAIIGIESFVKSTGRF